MNIINIIYWSPMLVKGANLVRSPKYPYPNLPPVIFRLLPKITKKAKYVEQNVKCWISNQGILFNIKNYPANIY